MEESESSGFRLTRRVDFPQTISKQMERISKFISGMDRYDPEHLNKLFDLLCDLADKAEYHSKKKNIKDKRDDMVNVGIELEKMDSYHSTEMFRMMLKEYRRKIIDVLGECDLLIEERELMKKHKR